MAELFVLRSNGGLIAATMEDAAQIAKLSFGKPILMTAKVPRNARMLSLYWVLCHRIANAVGSDPENVSDLLKIETGHCVIVKSKKYGELRLPRSISFAKCSDADFRDFFRKCADVICNEWGIAREDVLASVSDLLMPEQVHLK